MLKNSRLRPLLSVAIPSLLLLACGTDAQLGGGGDDPMTEPGEGGSEDPDDPAPEVESDIPAAVRALLGDGSEGSASLELVYEAPSNMFCPNASTDDMCTGLAVDLGFNPVREGELWVAYRQPYDGAPCTQTMQTGCAFLESRVVRIDDATRNNSNTTNLLDGNAWHFMRVVTAIAFGEDDTFSTVGEHRTGNFTDGAADFMGPSWWSSDPTIFAQDFNRNGSHLDMLHGTPYGMGIAHQEGTVYWAYNGAQGSLDRYDWNEPHVPGGEDHSDGELHRYLDGELGPRVVSTPSHLEFAEDNTTLYVVDTANQRILAVDTTTGEDDGPFFTPDPQLSDPRLMSDTTYTELVPRGTLTTPSGLAVFGEYVLVTDVTTSLIHVFDADGESVMEFDTELPADSLAGIEVGPDGKLYGVNWAEGSVFRVEVDQ